MTVLFSRQPNIGDGIEDQTSIYLILFNTILEITNTMHELHRSWGVISEDIRIREQCES